MEVKKGNKVNHWEKKGEKINSVKGDKWKVTELRVEKKRDRMKMNEGTAKGWSGI